MDRTWGEGGGSLSILILIGVIKARLCCTFLFFFFFNELAPRPIQSEVSYVREKAQHSVVPSSIFFNVLILPFTKV